MNKPNKLEMGLLRFVIARFKSKSPAGYALLAKVCGFASSAMLAYIIIYNQGLLPLKYAAIEAQADNYCIVLGAALSALGLGAASTTTDPALMSDRAKQNVLDQAVADGTHMATGEAHS
jgi:hypothetical protein